MAENADDDKRFSSNTTKKFVTRMHGGSIIHSNFKVNHHSVQKNKIRRSDSKSKSKHSCRCRCSYNSYLCSLSKRFKAYMPRRWKR